MNKIQDKTYGADVEFFLRNRLTGEIVSAEGYIQGSKYDPFRFDPANPHYSLSLDNVAGEITIPPATTARAFATYLEKAMAYVKSTLPEYLDVHLFPCANLDPKYLETEQAQAFGCEPDYNAYTMDMNDTPYCDDETLRSAGGHIHIGYDNIENPFDGNIYRYQVDPQRAQIVRSMDLHISVPLVLLEPDNKRKELYGGAGAFRPKEYGVEYRTVSNIYMINKKFKMWAFKQSKAAVNFLNTKGELDEGLSAHIRNTINNNDKEAARGLINDFNLVLV